MNRAIRKSVPTVLEKIRRKLKIRFVSRDERKEAIKALKDKIISVCREKYPYTLVFISKYTRFSHKHQRLLTGLLLVYWADYHKYRRTPNIYVLRETDKPEVLDQFIDGLSSISESYLREIIIDKNIPIPKALKEFVIQN